jgi:DNA-binding transcriptional ArsR family regulator
MDQAVENPLHGSWMAILTDPVRLALLQALSECGSATTAQLCQRCHTSDPTMRRHLEALEALGLVREHPAERDGLTPGRPAKRYILDADVGTKVCALFELLSDPLVPMSAPASRPPQGRETVPEPCM